MMEDGVWHTIDSMEEMIRVWRPSMMKFMGRSGYLRRRHWYKVLPVDRGQLGIWAFVYSSDILLDVVLYKDMEEFRKDWRKDPHIGTRFAKKWD